jgi:hypothetical protein
VKLVEEVAEEEEVLWIPLSASRTLWAATISLSLSEKRCFS